MYSSKKVTKNGIQILPLSNMYSFFEKLLTFFLFPEVTWERTTVGINSPAQTQITAKLEREIFTKFPFPEAGFFTCTQFGIFQSQQGRPSTFEKIEKVTWSLSNHSVKDQVPGRTIIGSKPISIKISSTNPKITIIITVHLPGRGSRWNKDTRYTGESTCKGRDYDQ